MFGFYNLRKPPGPTSHDLVAGLRRKLPRKTKVGHAGTLDPFAEGVVVLCAGPATRLASFVQDQPKAYRAVVRLGVRSTTDDPEGTLSPAENASLPDEKTIRTALGAFVGHIRQVPPAHSAVHVNGRRAYELARKGESPKLQAREVHVHAVELLDRNGPDLTLEVRCGSGTYIRSIARDLGEALGTGGYCASLRRTAIGHFTLEEAREPDALDLSRDLVKPQAGIGLPIVSISDAEARALRNGRPIPTSCLGPLVLRDDQQVSLVDGRERLLALAGLAGEGTLLQPTRVFPTEG